MRFGVKLLGGEESRDGCQNMSLLGEDLWIGSERFAET